MNEEQYAAIREELAANRQEHESYNRRLREHDEKLERQGDILIMLERLTNTVQNLSERMGEMNTSVKGMDKRLDEIEREPADKWRKITWEIIKGVVIAIVSAGAALFLKG